MPHDLELWLVRHGETTANAAKIVSGWSDVPLTARGEAQAAVVNAWLAGRPFDGVWSSDLSRAVSTARIAWGAATPDRRLREMHFGEIEGHRFEEVDPAVKASLLEFEDFCAPGGETMAGFRARLIDFVEALPRGRHLLFTHGGVIRVLARDRGDDRFVSNGGLVVLDWTAARLVEVREIPQDFTSGDQ
jgi:probable phosphoglycerate mutase